jgi:hypothetical protein
MKLAYFLGEGRGGTPTDHTQAYKWYDIAASIVGAKNRLGTSVCAKMLTRSDYP